MRRGALMRDLIRTDAWKELESWMQGRIEAETAKVMREVQTPEEYASAVNTVNALRSILRQPQRWIEKGDEARKHIEE